MRSAWALAGGILAAGCALPQQVLARPDDLADYRAFRMAAHEGRRLYEAQRYLERHPRGAWADEVRAAFEVEEAAWFEAAKTSRTRAREYVIDLPQGPHVDAARSLLVLFDEHQDDVETLALLSEARRTAATLDYETGRRHRVSDVILSEVAALADPATWGARLDAPPPSVAAVMRGNVAQTWGGASHANRHDALFFVVPTPPGQGGAQDRVVDVTFQLWLEDGRVAQGMVQGRDLFVLWGEALLLRTLDPSSPPDRAAAVAAVVDVIGGALEATLPASRCTAAPRGGEILARACDGWTASVRVGEQGAEDAIEVRGPLALKPVGAPPPGMR
jgi:hypothetical protein